MSDPHPSAQRSDPNWLLAQDYNQYLPQILQSTAGAVLPTEQTLLDANKVLTPQQSQLALDNYKNFAPQFAAAGGAAQQAAGQSNLGLLQGLAPQLGAASYQANIAGDPYTEQNRARVSGGLNTLFGSLDNPNNISGSEHSNIERSLARSNFSRGNEAPSATSTVESAMKYGAAGDALKAQKQSAINSAIGSAVGSAPALSTGVNSTSLALGGASSNPGMGQFSGPTQAGGTEFNFGNNLAGNQTTLLGGALSADANRRQFDTRVNQGVTAAGSVAGSTCCFIFAEAYLGHIPWYVRKTRDDHYTPAIRRGYVWMSRWLVPAMQFSSTVRDFVFEVMIFPLTQHAAYHCNIAKTPRPAYKRFWLSIWNLLGHIFTNV